MTDGLVDAHTKDERTLALTNGMKRSTLAVKQLRRIYGPAAHQGKKRGKKRVF